MRLCAVGLVLVAGLAILWPVLRLRALAGLPARGIPVGFCRLLLALLRIRIACDPPPREVGARLIVANHVSWIDILALASVEPLCFLAKREVGAWPIIGGLATAQGTVYIDRSRRRHILGANANLALRLLAGRSVVLFPEGTTFACGRRGRFLTSHLGCLRDWLDRDARAVLVQPVGLDYRDPAAAWIGDDTLLPHVWAMLGRPGLTCRIAWGAPMEVARGFDRKALGRDLVEAVETLLTDHPDDATVRVAQRFHPVTASNC